MSKIETATKWMEDMANDNRHGYDQDDRWGEYGDYDCSSAVITAWQSAGVPVKSNGATYTGNMYNVFIKCGFRDVTPSVNLATGAGLCRGDVLLNHVNHVAMYCGNNKEVEASINEYGTAHGGKPGDQTGKEFLIRSYRNYPWNVILRYSEQSSNTGNKNNDPTGAARGVLLGEYGNGAARVQNLKAAGYNPNEVQELVNLILKYETVARDVIAGKYGNGDTRIKKLKKKGYNPDQIQKVVNALL